MALTYYTFDQLITFTRTSAATYVNSAGNIVSASAGTPRFDYDPVTLQPRGLLIEEQRTNLLLNSTIDGANLATQSVSVSAVAHTLSFYGTGSVVLSGVHSATVSGGGAYPTRTTLTFTPSAGTLTLTVTGTVQFAQLEAGSFATSYIPTAGSQVTRAADQASIVAPMFAPWYNQSEGTFVVEWRIPNANASTGRYSVKATSPTVPQGLGVWTNTNSIETRGWVGATSIIAGNASLSAVNKAAFAYKATDNAISLNGAAPVTSSATGPTDSNALEIGGSSGSASQINGHIRSIKYFPTRLSNTQLQALTV